MALEEDGSGPFDDGDKYRPEFAAKSLHCSQHDGVRVRVRRGDVQHAS